LHLCDRRQRQMCIRDSRIQVGETVKLTGDALTAYQQAIEEGVKVRSFDALLANESNSAIMPEGIVVDALLGTGLKGLVRGECKAAIELINRLSIQRDIKVCAVDSPSGLCTDTGSILGCAVNADITVTYIGLKQGLLTASGPQQCGEIFFAGLNVPDSVLEQVEPSTARIDRPYVAKVLGKRDRGAHKGSYGHVVVIGGDHGMGGAVMMASEAAHYVGAGVVTVLTRGEHIAPLLSRHPECMALDADTHSSTIDEIIAKATVIVAGPGIGKGAWAVSLLQKALMTDIPLVLDADGLNFLTSDAGAVFRQRGNWVLTPHPGEAARLLQCSTKDIALDRFHCVQQLSDRYNAVVTLKGAGTLISTEVSTEVATGSSTGIVGRVHLANVGNPGMATAGMGDVLSGVIGGLLAQQLPLLDAANAGVWLHGKAADCAVKESGERGLQATDLFPYIRRLVNGKQTLCKHI
ncbi:MAG: NAD(P)H-hydrate dehydratase, partial [Pseudomonadales bacterium]|nr:NAD(P)H-hydrate dehydratase [Pseudomonadales bacterium]